MKFKYQCPKHPEYRIDFLQVGNLDTDKEKKNLFYCSVCVDTDTTFNLQNFQFIQHIVKSGIDEILPKWPPLSDGQLLNELIKIAQVNEEQTQQMEVQIDAYFKDLKFEVLQQLDISHKKMIEYTQQLLQNRIQIIDKYKELSKINELKSILIDNKSDILQREKTYRAFAKSMMSEKNEVNEQFTSLLNQHKQKQTVFNSDYALQIKESILQNIKNINFYQCSSTYYNNPKMSVKLEKTYYNNGLNCLEITKNDKDQQQVVVKEEYADFNIVSDIILQSDKKYVFRIEIQLMNEGNGCMIGLLQDSIINRKYGYDDCLSCFLKCNNNTISKNNSQWGIDDLVKGTHFQLSKENVIEMRVCIQDQVLQILDFPNYHSKLVLQHKYKNNLINKNNLRLYIGMWNLNNTIILKDAFTVDQFL